MSPTRSAFALGLIAVGALAATVYGDLAAGPALPRETLLLVAIASGVAALLSLLVTKAGSDASGAVLIVRDGTVTSVRDAVPGRTVSLLVHSGQAVVTETLGHYSRVLPPGLAALRRGESVFKIVQTSPRTLSGTVECETREGIPVGVDFEVSGQISAAPVEPTAGAPARRDPLASPAGRPVEGPAWSSAAVVRAAYETHNWEAALMAETRAALRDVVVQTCLDALCGPTPGSSGPRHGLDALQDRARPRVSAAARDWGVSITSLLVHNLHLPAEVASTRLRWWTPRTGSSHPRAGRSGAAGEVSASHIERPAFSIAPVVGREGFSTLRQAIRQPSAWVRSPTISVDGRLLYVHPMVPGCEDLLIGPDRSHFAVRVQGSSLSDLGLADGDYVVLEESQETTDGDVVALISGARVALWRYWKRPDHILLSPEIGARAPIALVSPSRVAAAIRQRYQSHHPPVQIAMESDVKILGRAVAALRESPDDLGATRVLDPVGDTRMP